MFSTHEVTCWTLGQQHRRFTADGYPHVPQRRRGGYLSRLANLSMTSSTPPLGIEMSRMQQPDIDLKLHVIVDSFSGGDFDFISHYENPTFFASIGPPVSWLTPLQFSTFSSRPGDSRKGGLRKLVILTKHLYVG